MRLKELFCIFWILNREMWICWFSRPVLSWALSPHQMFYSEAKRWSKLSQRHQFWANYEVTILSLDTVSCGIKEAAEMADMISSCLLHHLTPEFAVREQLRQELLQKGRGAEVKHDKAVRGSGLTDKDAVPLHPGRARREVLSRAFSKCFPQSWPSESSSKLAQAPKLPGGLGMYSGYRYLPAL